MNGPLLIRLGILGLLLVAAVLFFLRPRFGGGKGGPKGSDIRSVDVFGTTTPPDGHAHHGHGTSGGTDGGD